VLALAIWMWTTQSLLDPSFFPWAVLTNSIVTIVLIAFFVAHTGCNRITSWAPLVFLGQLAYSTYLVHWPVFLLLDEERLPWLGFWGLFVVRIVVTYAVVLAIFYLFEDPVRRGKMLPGKRLYPVLGVMAVVSLGFVLWRGDRVIERPFDPQALALQQAALDALPVLAADAPVTASGDPTLPSRVLVVGDSQAWILGNGLKDWGAPLGMQAEPSPGTGCGIGENTPIRYLKFEQDFRPGCQEWRDALPKIVDKLDPQVVVVAGGLADLSDRRIPGVDGWSHIGEPAYDEWLLGQMTEFADRMTADGATVLWLSHPYVDIPYSAGATGKPPFPENDPARMDRYNELIRQVAEEHPAVEFADFGTYVEQVRATIDGDLQPDGAHIDLQLAPQILDWIGDEIRRVQASRG
jgi:lysophospholipase L1-like esterase